MAEYVVQINVKVGDHLININGDTPESAFLNLQELAKHTDEIHAALSQLDGGRPATEIVQKEKTWGARSQGGRSYAAKSGGSSGNFSQNSSAPRPSGAPSGVMCQIHGKERLKFPAGTNAAGRDYSASLRCPEKNCTALWEQKDGSFA